METLSALMVICDGNLPVTSDSPHKGPVMIFPLCNMLLTKLSSSQWFETTFRSCNATVIADACSVFGLAAYQTISCYVWPCQRDMAELRIRSNKPDEDFLKIEPVASSSKMSVIYGNKFSIENVWFRNLPGNSNLQFSPKGLAMGVNAKQ